MYTVDVFASIETPANDWDEAFEELYATLPSSENNAFAVDGICYDEPSEMYPEYMFYFQMVYNEDIPTDMSQKEMKDWMLNKYPDLKKKEVYDFEFNKE